MATPQEVIKYVESEATLAECSNIATLVATRWAAQSEAAHAPTDQAWSSVAYYQEQLFRQTEDKPQEAFRFAVDQVLLSPGDTAESEYYRQWVRGNGTTNLTDFRLKDLLFAHLATPDSGPLLDAVNHNLSQPMPSQPRFDDLYDPRFYLYAISLKLALSLGEHQSPKVIDLYNRAQDLQLSRPTQNLLRVFCNEVDGMNAVFGELLLSSNSSSEQ